MESDRNTKAILRQWVMNCTAGELIGMGVAGCLAVAVNSWMGEPVTIGQKFFVLSIMLLAGVVEGSAIALFQWRVLRRLFPLMRLIAWWRWTVLIAVMWWAIGMTPSLFFTPATSTNSSVLPSWIILAMAAVGGAMSGAAFGWFQSFELRKHTPLWGAWIMANAVGWMVAMVIIVAGATWPSVTTPKGYIVASAVVSGSLAGLVIGISTRFVLKNLINRVPKMAHKLTL